MNRLRYTAICWLDVVDAYLLNHCVYAFCCWIGNHWWWEALCRNGCEDDGGGFCSRCGWRIEH